MLALISRIENRTTVSANRATSAISTGMRAPVRKSASSLRNTTPAPRSAEPSRRMDLPSLRGKVLEIAVVDHFQARRLDVEPAEPAAGADHLRRRRGAHVAVGDDPD